VLPRWVSLQLQLIFIFRIGTGGGGMIVMDEMVVMNEMIAERAIIKGLEREGFIRKTPPMTIPPIEKVTSLRGRALPSPI
jgi:hypothetical protein